MEKKTAKISTKGQLTIPKEFRKKLNIHAGNEVIIFYQEDKLVIKPKTKDLKVLRGLLSEEIDLKKANKFLIEKRKKWRI